MSKPRRGARDSRPRHARRGAASGGRDRGEHRPVPHVRAGHGRQLRRHPSQRHGGHHHAGVQRVRVVPGPLRDAPRAPGGGAGFDGHRAGLQPVPGQPLHRRRARAAALLTRAGRWHRVGELPAGPGRAGRARPRAVHRRQRTGRREGGALGHRHIRCPRAVRPTAGRLPRRRPPRGGAPGPGRASARLRPSDLAAAPGRLRPLLPGSAAGDVAAARGGTRGVAP